MNYKSTHTHGTPYWSTILRVIMGILCTYSWLTSISSYDTKVLNHEAWTVYMHNDMLFNLHRLIRFCKPNKRFKRRQKIPNLFESLVEQSIAYEIRNRFHSKLKTEGVRYKLNSVDKSVDFMKRKQFNSYVVLSVWRLNVKDHNIIISMIPPKKGAKPAHIAQQNVFDWIEFEHLQKQNLMKKCI